MSFTTTFFTLLAVSSFSCFSYSYGSSIGNDLLLNPKTKVASANQDSFAEFFQVITGISRYKSIATAHFTFQYTTKQALTIGLRTEEGSQFLDPTDASGKEMVIEYRGEKDKTSPTFFFQQLAFAAYPVFSDASKAINFFGSLNATRFKLGIGQKTVKLSRDFKIKDTSLYESEAKTSFIGHAQVVEASISTYWLWANGFTFNVDWLSIDFTPAKSYSYGSEYGIIYSEKMKSKINTRIKNTGSSLLSDNTTRSMAIGLGYSF